MKIVGASQMGPMVTGIQPEVLFILILIIIIISVIIISIIIVIIIIVIIIIVIIIIVIIIMKQGSTSDAEMLAEAAMLREHRNRLENRMVTIIRPGGVSNLNLNFPIKG